MESKIQTAKALFEKYFEGNDNNDATTAAIAVAPGRVNLIGEHTDYTGGFVLPFAIDYSTVVYGEGSVTLNANANANTDENESGGKRKAKIRFASSLSPDSVETFEITESSTPPETPVWTTYVVGTVFQYLKDLPEGSELGLDFSISGDVPLGSGLSSSASLEVAVGRFVEAILGEHAFSSEPNKQEEGSFSPAKTRALRCQKAENEWCDSPCGIMDQAISSAGTFGSLVLIDCRTLDFTPTKMAETSLSPEDPMPVFVVTNSNIKHSIGGGEYPIRVAQCKSATEALQKVNPSIAMLRDATMEDVEKAKEFMNDVEYNRAKHVVTENERTVRARNELEQGDWKKVGGLMNASHASMRDDYEVSCEEIDILVDIAQNFPGVYGSRLTGGGFGGCTVTLVSEDRAEDLMAHIQSEYKAKTGIDCPCFVTRPARGAHLVSTDDFKPIVVQDE
jgi:galactokinase